MKKSIIKIMTVFLLMILTFSLSSAYSNATIFSRYDIMMSDILQHMSEDPSVKLPEIYYKANKDKDPNTFLSLSDLKKLTGNENSEEKGRYTLEKLMTFREFVDMGVAGVNLYIDPDRMVWVLTFEHSDLYDYNGVMLKNVVTTTVWDAETGDSISLMIHTDDPNFQKVAEQRHQTTP